MATRPAALGSFGGVTSMRKSTDHVDFHPNKSNEFFADLSFSKFVCLEPCIALGLVPARGVIRPKKEVIVRSNLSYYISD